MGEVNGIFPDFRLQIGIRCAMMSTQQHKQASSRNFILRR